MNPRNNNHNISLASLVLRPIGILLTLIILGTVSYMKIEGWEFLDSLFMSVETLTTVGFGLIAPLSATGKIFTIIYILFGVMLFLYIVAEFAEYILFVNFGKVLSKKKMETRLKKMKNHYIVCGYGRTGSEITKQLKNNKLEFIVIDKDPDFESTAQSLNIPYVAGDATEDSILEKAEIEKAKGLFCALSDDVDNLYLTVSAKSLNPKLSIVSRCIKASNEHKFKKAGATTIILPYEISARRMVSSVVKPQVVDFLDVVMHTKGQELELKLEQFRIEEGSPLEEQTILSSELRQKSGVIVVAIRRDGEFITNPTPDTMIKAGDYLITLGTSSQLSKFEEIYA
ncbi:MAG: TrkA family potassium uptake protein [uncultured bacterium]|nr:MAG: TrkA family potassium uptake protein [uncultured bacterium]